MTDVTGFGLLGHALEMARGAGSTGRHRVDSVPLLAAGRERWREQGFVTGASHRNWASYGEAVVPADRTAGLAAPPADRSADLRRSARRLRRRAAPAILAAFGRAIRTPRSSVRSRSAIRS